MHATDPGTAREEAERLVAAVLAAASLGAASLATRATRAGVATGSAECCACPLCRAIAGVRDPRPEFAERLATGAGDLAAGLASLLRSLAGGHPPPGAAAGEDEPERDGTWRAATRAAAEDEGSR